MGSEKVIAMKKPAADTSNAGAPDTRERLLVMTLELSKRALAAKDANELFYLLTNDIRIMIPFDRSLLIGHFDGKSQLLAVGNQPLVETKSEYYEQAKVLAGHLKTVNRPMLLSNRTDVRDLADESLSKETKEALAQYIELCGTAGFFCIPLVVGEEAIAHLILEFLDDRPPDQTSVIATLQLAPFMAGALAQKWLTWTNPQSLPLTGVRSWRDRPAVKAVWPYARIGVLLAILVGLVLFVVPFPYTVGGEAEIMPRDRFVAFSKIDGLVDRILVREGQAVELGQPLAVLDPTELDYKIKMAERQIELMGSEMALLMRSGAQDPSKIAESRLSELKLAAAAEELRFLTWQRQFLTITAPAAGIITSKGVETLAGKKFRAGESFAEIAVPGDLVTEIFVPEDRIAYVKRAQEATVYLNGDPLQGFATEVTEVAPRSEALPRLGNVFRVRTAFRDTIPELKVGMKGVGKIDAGTASLWSIATQRLVSKWNQLKLHFW
jgi:hypothetical protein